MNDRENNSEGFETYNLEKDAVKNDNPEKGYSGLKCLKYLINILFSPVEGWKKLKRDRLSVEKLERGCYYPLLAGIALSELVGLLFYSHSSFGSACFAGIMSIVILFFSYYVVVALGGLLPAVKGIKPLETAFGKEFVIISLSSLALFGIMSRLLPMLGPVTVFLPIWTIYIISKGVRRLGYTEQHGMTPTVILSVLVIGIPLCLEWVMERFMPAL